MVGEVFFLFYLLASFSTALKLIQLKAQQSGLFTTVYWPDGDVRVDSVPYTHASTFEVHEVADGQWQLRALKNNMFLTAENGGGGDCVADRAEASGWETFNITYLEDDSVQLQTFTGNWLGVDDMSSSAQLVAKATTAGKKETFSIVEVPQHRAVNVGSWFIPEKWMFADTSALWANTTATDYYSLCEELGPAEATARMQAHWESWFTEADFQEMQHNGVNHIRLPMGYWDMIDSPPYVFGGAKYIDRAVQWAAAYNMTVLIDLHGAPGSQNGQDHSGHSGEINWDEPENVALTVVVLGMMAQRWASIENVWGFELLNEPGYDLSHELLTQFYRDGYAAIRKYSDDAHVVMNSLYGPHDWTASVLPEPEYRNAVLDLHLYTVWSGFTTAEQHYAQASSWGEEIRALTPYYPVIVGEMSLATGLEGYTEAQRQEFADDEMISFRDNAFGYVFWSDKLQYKSEDWSFVDAAFYIQQYYQV